MQQTDVRCVGFIMDGNRRFAKEQGLPTIIGHKRGGEVFEQSIEWVQSAGISHAVYYAFSTENWKRNAVEVGYLMDLFRELLESFTNKAEKKASTIRVRIVGRRSDFAPDLQAQMKEIEAIGQETSAKVTTIWIALSYGGRAEIVEAVNQAITHGDVATEESFEKLLWTAEMPDPDIIIRTGGEHRLSNFMTWKSVYSEFFFLNKHWPALTRDDFEGILMQYGERERRKGA
jgi:undecaprenyl diphosphate synthase